MRVSSVLISSSLKSGARSSLVKIIRSASLACCWTRCPTYLSFFLMSKLWPSMSTAHWPNAKPGIRHCFFSLEGIATPLASIMTLSMERDLRLSRDVAKSSCILQQTQPLLRLMISSFDDLCSMSSASMFSSPKSFTNTAIFLGKLGVLRRRLIRVVFPEPK